MEREKVEEPEEEIEEDLEESACTVCERNDEQTVLINYLYTVHHKGVTAEVDGDISNYICLDCIRQEAENFAGQ